MRGFRAFVVSWLITVAGSSAAAAQPAPTFNKDIAPIVWRRCATCHRPGEIGPFSLLTYDDVRTRATLIGSVTERGLMPPWKPINVGLFQDERRLTDPERTAIARWIAAGALEGAAADLSPAPSWNDGWQLGAPDLVVRMAEAYTVPADGSDVFRTFVLPIPLAQARYVRALEFRPGNARVVHHANIGVDRTRSSRRLDARDPLPGYAGNMERDARYPEGQLLGWTPGQAAHPAPDGTQWRLEPGSDLVVQLHLQPTGKPETLQASIGVFLTDAAPVRTPIGLRLGSETIDIPAGAAAHVVSDRYTLPVDADVLAIQPHAHNLARRMDATATLPDGTTRSLITIDDWDFRWQDVYRYQSPVTLPKGTTIAMRYAYDNSAGNPRNPHAPPARVVWGQNTSDEMGDLWIQMVPLATADFVALNTDVQRKQSAEDLAAYTTLLAADPANPLRHDAVAALYLEAGRLDEAVIHWRRSLALNPQSAPTHYNLGFTLARRGERDEAVSEFRAAIRLDPDYAQAHHNLAAMVQFGGRPEDVAEALTHFERAVTLLPDNLEALTNFGQLLSRIGRAAGAIDRFRAVLAAQADHAPALSGLAWIRATAADPALRNPAEAVVLAERAAALTHRQDVSVIDALAAAYASAERFEEAVAAARLGIALATAAGQTVVAAQFTRRLTLYQTRQPFRMPML